MARRALVFSESFLLGAGIEKILDWRLACFLFGLEKSRFWKGF